MKSSVAVLFAIWCVTLCASAPGAPAPNNPAEYAPTFQAWRDVFKKIVKHVPTEDHEFVAKLGASVADIEKAVLAKDLPTIAHVYEDILPGAKNLLSHFKHPRLKEVFAASIHHVEDLLQQLKSPDANMDHVNLFLKKVVEQSTVLLKEILVEVQEEVASN